MTQLGEPVPDSALRIRRAIARQLRVFDIALVDADAAITGRDFLRKIWGMIVSVPLGIAVITEDMNPSSLANIFYELGLLHALGKEALIVKTEAAKVPSDFVRTEYVPYDRQFARRFRGFLGRVFDQASYCETMGAELTQGSPILALHYLLRAYLISGEGVVRKKALELLDDLVEQDESLRPLRGLLGSPA